MKKWIDADKIIRMVTYLEDPELRELEIQMQEKPNFNHSPDNDDNKKKRKMVKNWN